jgi:hypothetical protein
MVADARGEGMIDQVACTACGRARARYGVCDRTVAAALTKPPKRH